MSRFYQRMGSIGQGRLLVVNLNQPFQEQPLPLPLYQRSNITLHLLPMVWQTVTQDIPPETANDLPPLDYDNLEGPTADKLALASSLGTESRSGWLRIFRSQHRRTGLDSRYVVRHDATTWFCSLGVTKDAQWIGRVGP